MCGPYPSMWEPIINYELIMNELKNKLKFNYELIENELRFN
jgi:hypothetical protein